MGPEWTARTFGRLDLLLYSYEGYRYMCMGLTSGSYQCDIYYRPLQAGVRSYRAD